MSADTTDDTPGAALRRRFRLPPPSSVSLFYLYAIGFLIFSLWIPDLWLQGATPRVIANIAFAMPALVAVGLVLPLNAGVYDLSIAGAMSLSSVTVAWLMVDREWPVAMAIVAAVGVSLVLGLLNGLLIEVIGVDSFVATLATGAVAGAVALWRSDSQQIVGFPESFTTFGNREVFAGLQIHLLYLAVVSVVVWAVLERTTAGRYIHAIGENREAVRLAGVRTRRYVMMTLLASAGVAGFAGVLQTAKIGAGSSSIGSPYLLFAFAACFLGATQFRGTVNVVGTVLAVWVLASGVQGVTLATSGYPWLNGLFFGAALIVSVSVSRVLVRHTERRSIKARADHVAVAPTDHVTDARDSSTLT
jgi:ribose transport system permease protein